jgi:hypothetical protein
MILSGAEGMRSLVVLAICMMLAACGAARQVVEEESDSPGPNLNNALAECRDAFPDQIVQAVQRAACVVKATELVRPVLPFPELLDQENALRKSLAEQVQNGRISLLERNSQIHGFHAKIVEEERSRLRAARSDPEKKSLAVMQWRSSNPEACTRLGGNSAYCY